MKREFSLKVSMYIHKQFYHLMLIPNSTLIHTVYLHLIHLSLIVFPKSLLWRCAHTAITKLNPLIKTRAPAHKMHQNVFLFLVHLQDLRQVPGYRAVKMAIRALNQQLAYSPCLSHHFPNLSCASIIIPTTAVSRFKMGFRSLATKSGECSWNFAITSPGYARQIQSTQWWFQIRWTTTRTCHVPANKLMCLGVVYK